MKNNSNVCLLPGVSRNEVVYLQAQFTLQYPSKISILSEQKHSKIRTDIAFAKKTSTLMLSGCLTSFSDDDPEGMFQPLQKKRARLTLSFPFSDPGSEL